MCLGAASARPLAAGCGGRPAPFGRFAEQARFHALELAPAIGYCRAPERSSGIANEAKLRSTFSEPTIGVSTIQFDHQWEDIDVEA